MSNQISNKEEFQKLLTQLGNLYEEGKDCLNAQAGAIYNHPHSNQQKFNRLFNILQEMRDIAAVQMQKIHWIPEN